MPERTQRILYIEDNEEMIDLVKVILETKGYQVAGALGGAEGWRAIQELLPDLVLLDLMMPDVDAGKYIRIFEITMPRNTSQWS